MKTNKIFKNIILIFFSILLISLLSIYILNYFKVSIPSCINSNNTKCYNITMLSLTVPFIIYVLLILKNGIVKLFNKNLSTDLLISISSLTCFIYSLVNVIFILKGKNSFDNNLYFIPSALIIYFTYLSNMINKEDNNLVDKYSHFMIIASFIISLMTLVAYLELETELSQSIRTSLMILMVSCSCSVPIIKLIKNSESYDAIIIDKSNIVQEIEYKMSDLNNYSPYTDEELTNIIASLECKSKNKIFESINHDKKVVNYKKTNNNISGKIEKTIFNIGKEDLVKKQKVKNNYLELVDKLTNEGKEVLYVISKRKIIAIFAIEKTKKESNLDITSLKEITDNILIANTNIEKDKYIEELNTNNYLILNETMNNKDKLTIKDNVITNVNKNNINSISSIYKPNKKNKWIIKENIVIALSYNLLLIIIATGLTKKFITFNTMILIIAMGISLLLTIINTLRIKNHDK